MRICIVSQEYPPVTDYHGGIGTQYGRLAPALAALGHELHVILLAPKGPTEPIVAGVHVHPLERPRLWPWFELAWARRVRTKIHELGPFDSILSPEFRGECVLYADDQSSGPLVTHLVTSLRQLLASPAGAHRVGAPRHPDPPRNVGGAAPGGAVRGPARARRRRARLGQGVVGPRAHPGPDPPAHDRRGRGARGGSDGPATGGIPRARAHRDLRQQDGWPQGGPVPRRGDAGRLAAASRGAAGLRGQGRALEARDDERPSPRAGRRAGRPGAHPRLSADRTRTSRRLRPPM